ncbi:MAG: glutaredoxin family protein [Euryarchaeota archaeon]|nr:glutaredoxin family protein [Euryarchaeota archaeon]
MKSQHVDGENREKIFLFALSTCGWCKKVRMLLENLGLEYDYIYVDLLEGAERDEAVEELRHCNPQLSFPTLVINDEKCIVGYNKSKIMEALE